MRTVCDEAAARKGFTLEVLRPCLFLSAVLCEREQVRQVLGGFAR
jgi:hypothetical protein